MLVVVKAHPGTAWGTPTRAWMGSSQHLCSCPASAPEGAGGEASPAVSTWSMRVIHAEHRQGPCCWGAGSQTHRLLTRASSSRTLPALAYPGCGEIYKEEHVRVLGPGQPPHTDVRSPAQLGGPEPLEAPRALQTREEEGGGVCLKPCSLSRPGMAIDNHLLGLRSWPGKRARSCPRCSRMKRT